MSALIDVNVLVALMHERHRHSRKAVAWLEDATERRAIAICRVVQMGTLRILTNPTIMKEDTLTATEFWRGWDRVVADDRFGPVAEPSTFEVVWRSLTSALPRGSTAGTDAYLAAFAIAGRHRLSTFDLGFRRFPELDLEILA